MYPWGNELELDGIHRCNVLHGDFPSENTLEDGYHETAPVDAFYTNDYGIQKMIGNVWELCSNKARIDREEIQVESIDEQIEIYQQGSIDYYAAKGGSFLCHESYCNRYRLKARNGVDRLTSASNIGFRCVQE
ncbi:formylglycine-generating enzyme family protein [Erysipelothrix sp. HDW6A]|nr:formylglycine-generating enzyme family protein [Erysipelothrix sp. HDW6A]